MDTNLRFLFPIDGDMLHKWDGTWETQTLHLPIRVEAPAGHELLLNGQPMQTPTDSQTPTAGTPAAGAPAAGTSTIYSATLPLSGFRENLTVFDQTTGQTQTITVYVLPHFAGKYRLSIDDNIWFLRDIAQHAYTSLFEQPFLGFLKAVHEQYGTCVHLNLFYQTDGFTLADFPDRYKPEWQANAHWLRLSFHGRSEFPDRPYRNANYQQVYQDCETVKREIKRFAGTELMGPVTTLHWGEAAVEGSCALRDHGYVAQLGYFNVDDNLPAVSYYLTPTQRRHIKKRFVWHDNREDITFVRCSLVLDKTDVPDIAPTLDAYTSKPPFVDLLVHEQYFYPFYEAYQPDYRERILTAVRWADRNGYTPSFLGDALFSS